MITPGLAVDHYPELHVARGVLQHVVVPFNQLNCQRTAKGRVNNDNLRLQMRQLFYNVILNNEDVRLNATVVKLNKVPYFFPNRLFICHLVWDCVREATKAIQPVMNTSGTQGQWSFECNILWLGPQNNLGLAELPITVESFWINAEGLVCLVLASRSSILEEVSTLFNGGDMRACEASSDPSCGITPGVSYNPNGIKAYRHGPRAATPCPARCISAFEQLKAHACMNMQFMNISE